MWGFFWFVVCLLAAIAITAGSLTASAHYLLRALAMSKPYWVVSQYKCLECGNHFYTNSTREAEPNFCTYCGKRMVDVEIIAQRQPKGPKK